MALIELTLQSQTLGATTTVWVSFPEETGGDRQRFGQGLYQPGVTYQTLWLLHGGGDDCSCWFRYTNVERYANERKLIVVCPSAYLSCYADMHYGPKYYTWVTEELPQILRWMLPISPRREDNFVAGLSMGGYGALKWAFNQPERFAAVGTFCGAVDMPAIIRANHMKDGVVTDNNFVLAFGDDKAVEHNEADALYMAEQQHAAGVALPRIFCSVGSQDFTYRFNAGMRERFAAAGIDMTWDEHPGGHEWGYWDGAVLRFMDWAGLKRAPIIDKEVC